MEESAYILKIFAISFSLGIVIGFIFTYFHYGLILSLLLSLILLSFSITQRKKPWTSIFVITAIAITYGHIQTSDNDKPKDIPKHMTTFYGEALIHTQWKTSKKGNKYWTSIFEIKTQSIKGEISFPLKIRVYGSQYLSPPTIGNFYTFTGKIKYKKTYDATPFHMFSYHKDHSASLWINGKSWKQEEEFALSFSRICLPIRSWLIQNIDTIYSEKSSSFIKAIFMGDKSELDKNIYNAFQLTGTAHLLAVSGAHIGIIGIFLWWLGRLLHISRVNLSWILFIILIFYLGAIGSPPAATRAVIMYLIICPIRYSIDRRYNTTDGFMLCFLGFLIFDPNILEALSFQLSFAGVFGILWTMPLITSWLKKKLVRGAIKKKPFLSKGLTVTIGAITVSIAASIWVDPLVSWHFGILSSTSIIANLGSGLLVAALLTLTMLSLIGAAVTDILGLIIPNGYAEIPAELLLSILEDWVRMWAFGGWVVEQPSIQAQFQLLVSAIPCLAWTSWWIHRRLKKFKGI